MLETELKLTVLKLDFGKFTKTLFDDIDTQIRQAARAWLRAILLSDLPPVWTGTARGSLKPLGQFLRVSVPINPVATRSGMGPGVGASQSSFSFERGEISKFIWETEVLHYKINEFNDVSHIIHLKHPVPWHSMEIGKRAFKDYIDTYLKKRIPKISEFLFEARIT